MALVSARAICYVGTIRTWAMGSGVQSAGYALARSLHGQHAGQVPNVVRNGLSHRRSVSVVSHRGLAAAVKEV
jgi:hypothetical protein